MDTAHPTQEETTVSETDPQTSANRLVLPSLEIRNFRAFRHLTIEKLGRVNLITGKNNVGKTSLLEALWLYAERGSPEAIRKILLGRDEVFVSQREANENSGGTHDAKNEVRYDLATRFSSLFHGRERMGGYEQEIMIGGLDGRPRRQVSLRFKHIKGASINSQAKEAQIASPYENGAVDAIEVSISPQFEFTDYKLPLTQILSASGSYGNFLDTFPHQFVNSFGLDSEQNALLWDNVALTAEEDTVEDALRILSPELVRVAFIPNSDTPTSRVPMVRMEGNKQAVPLRSMGEGVNRILGYVLSAANAARGILLIDEIENGLHYSVLPDVWRLIFQTARRLNVQVFATTHSWDCIEAFQQAASEDDDSGSGVLVRLRNKDGDIVSTVFDEDDLAVITRDGIEVR